MRTDPSRLASRRLVIGFAMAACAQLLSLFLAGAGHGWLSPLLASLLLWVVAPVALVVTAREERPNWKVLLPLMLIAVIADAWLIRATITEERALPFYIEVNGILGWAIVGLWVALWLYWQGIVLNALLTRRENH